MPKKPFNTLAKESILKVLQGHRGEVNRIPRRLLLAKVKIHLSSLRSPYRLTDRKLRSLLEELRGERHAGAWICASLRGGYFLARDIDELNDHLRSDEARVRNTARRIRTQRKLAGLQVSRQLELFSQDQPSPKESAHV